MIEEKVVTGRSVKALHETSGGNGATGRVLGRFPQGEQCLP